MYDESIRELTEMADSDETIERLSLEKKAKLSVLAVFCFLLKKKCGVIKDRKSDGLHSDNIDGFLVSNYRGDDLDRLLESCSGFVIRELTRIYKQNENRTKLY